MNWLRKFLLKDRKKRGLLETRADLKYILRYRKDWLEFNEPEARKFIREQDKLPEDKKDHTKLALASRNIAHHLATKKEYQDLLVLETDLINYIDLL